MQSALMLRYSICNSSEIIPTGFSKLCFDQNEELLLIMQFIWKKSLCFMTIHQPDIHILPVSSHQQTQKRIFAFYKDCNLTLWGISKGHLGFQVLVE